MTSFPLRGIANSQSKAALRARGGPQSPRAPHTSLVFIQHSAFSIQLPPLRSLAGDDLVVFALADSAERVVFAEGVTAEAVPGEDAAEIGVADEDDAEHVVDLALHPLGPGPDASDAVDLEAGVALLDHLLVAEVVAG